jgi:peptidoglycan/xylan/chitin deacetylase (PgdA/CDA1 family)
VPPASLRPDEEEDGIVRGIAAIERLCGRRPRGYRAPSWDLSPRTIGLLASHGFAYESSLMADDYQPYWARQGDIVELERPLVRGAPTRLVEMPVSWHLDDYPHFEFVRLPGSILPGLMNARGVLQSWVDEFRYMSQAIDDWGALTYAFHPFVIGRGYRMLILEELIASLRAMGAVFQTMEDTAAEWLARQAGASAGT